MKLWETGEYAEVVRYLFIYLFFCLQVVKNID